VKFEAKNDLLKVGF